MELTKNLIKIEEAAEILTCGTDTVRALIREGKLPVFRIHKNVTRLDRRDVEEYLRSCCQCADSTHRAKRPRPPKWLREESGYIPGMKVV